MKTSILYLGTSIILLAASCTKKDNANQVGNSSTNTVEKSSSIVKVTCLTTQTNFQRKLNIVVTYLPGDTTTYYLDQLLVYTDSANVISRDISIKGANQTQSLETPDFTATGNYRLYIKRMYSGIPKVDTIISMSGQ
jgi:hypothetical protein